MIRIIVLPQPCVGGVRVTIDVDGLEEQDPELKKGATVTLTGKQAEKFVM